LVETVLVVFRVDAAPFAVRELCPATEAAIAPLDDVPARFLTGGSLVGTSRLAVGSASASGQLATGPRAASLDLGWTPRMHLRRVHPRLGAWLPTQGPTLDVWARGFGLRGRIDLRDEQTKEAMSLDCSGWSGALVRDEHRAEHPKWAWACADRWLEGTPVALTLAAGARATFLLDVEGVAYVPTALAWPSWRSDVTTRRVRVHAPVHPQGWPASRPAGRIVRAVAAEVWAETDDFAGIHLTEGRGQSDLLPCARAHARAELTYADGTRDIVHSEAAALALHLRGVHHGVPMVA
jgi:hypothetical protein